MIGGAIQLRPTDTMLRGMINDVLFGRAEGTKISAPPSTLPPKKCFRRPSGGLSGSEFWMVFGLIRSPPEAHFVLYFMTSSAYRGVGDGASKGLFYGLKNSAQKWLQKT